MNHIFHVHTYRCGHATNEFDEEYIKKAIEIGATKITITDHAPFPGDPFNHRMRFSQLQEYIFSLKSLKNEYRDIIDIGIGLEIEYLPSFNRYYQDLKENIDIDLLMVGQHHYEISDGLWSFQLGIKQNVEKYMLSQIEAVRTGFFDVIAHPDRCLKFSSVGWTDQISKLSVELISESILNNVILEKNLASMKSDTLYWPQFWDLVPEYANTIIGIDAHSTNDLVIDESLSSKKGGSKHR